MKIVLFVISFLLILAVVFAQNKPNPNPVSVSDSSTPSAVTASPTPVQPAPEFIEPISGFSSRITKKPFAIRITPANSPVSPERFSGFHTGADAEIFPGEEMIDVRINAACSGKILAKRTASGYGGVVVQSCTYQGNPVTVLYGHLAISSIKVNVGDMVYQSDFLGLLGTGGTDETDNERKHLHFAIRRGTGVSLSGYVEASSDLSSWIDPVLVLSAR